MSIELCLPDAATVVIDMVEPGDLFELRVLSGLHQGAALPLFGEQWCIGAHQEADLELCDPGIEDQHARLHSIDGGWMVQAQEGLLQDETGATLARIANLVPGAEFSIGGIRLCIANAHSPWREAPVPASCVSSEVVPEHRRAPSEGRMGKWLIATLTVLLLAMAGLAMLPSSKVQPAVPPSSSVGDRRPLATTHQVHQQLLKMLIERELGNHLRLEVAADQITLRGDVTQEALALVSRMLERFEAQFETSISIINKAQEISTALPFRIVQVIGGKRAHVVLADGRRLFFGDEADGVRLTAIDNHRLLFEGKQLYEVNW